MTKKGFTLIEITFTVLIASILLAGIYGYFRDSLLNVAKGDETLSSIRDLQNLITVLREDLYLYKGFSNNYEAPVDLFYEFDRFPIEDRYFTNYIFDDRSLKSTPIPVKATVVKPKVKSKLNNHNFFQNDIEYDGFFRDKTILNASGLNNFYLGFSFVKREIDKPINATVEEHYLAVNNQVVCYRHYIKDDKENPLNFVTRITFVGDASNIKEKETHIFGKLHGASGRVTGFSITPLLEFSYFEDKARERQLRLVKSFFQVNLNFTGERQGTGPKGRTISQSFYIMHSSYNGNRYRNGTF